MADATQDVLVNIKGDASSLESAAAKGRVAVKGVGEETDKTAEKGKGLGSKFSIGSAAIGAAMAVGVHAVVDFAKQSIGAFNVAQGNIIKFQTAAGNAGWSKSLQEETTKSFGLISGGAARTAATTAASMGLTGETFEKLKGTAGDLAAKFGGVKGASDRFAGTSQLLSRAVASGSTASLRRLGVVLDDNTSKMFKNGDQTQRAQILAEAAKKSVDGMNNRLAATPSGQMQMLGNSITAVKTNLGGLLEGAVSPDKFVAALNNMINQGIKVFNMMAPKIVKAVAASLPALIAALIKVVPVLLTSIAKALVQNGHIIIKAMTTIFTTGSTQSKWLSGVALTIGGVVLAVKAWSAATKVWSGVQKIAAGAQWMMNTAMFSSPITWIVAGIALVVAGLVLFFTKTKVGKQAWSAFTRGLVNAWKWCGNALQAGWDWLKGVFAAGWNWINHRVFDPFKVGIHDIGQAFDTTSSWIRRAWDKVKDAAATPVRWVVNTVYTNGIQKVWNGIAGAVGLNLKLPNAPKFATGGIMPGYTPGRDVGYAAVSGGEAIMRPEWTQAVGADTINRWNALARNGGSGAIRADMGHFASGGIVGGLNAAWNWTKGIASTVADVVSSFVSDPGKFITDRIVSPVKGLLSSIMGGDWGKLIAQFPLKVVNALVGKAKSLFASMGGSSGSGGDASFNASAGVAQWKPQVLQALSMLGQPASWLNTVLRRMNQESGGNPNAINNWDSNAAAGMPSQGLMQTIPGTFAAYAGPFAGRGIRDPLANIYAGLNYAIHRYGSLSALDRPGGYWNGGRITGAGYEGLIRATDDEYMVNATASRSIGYRQLDQLNRTGKLPNGPVINVTTAKGTDTLALAQQLGIMLERA